jgi:predicted RNA-binding Zn-ribbon protein involved in translation (DUF1610 family)
MKQKSKRGKALTKDKRETRRFKDRRRRQQDRMGLPREQKSLKFQRYGVEAGLTLEDWAGGQASDEWVEHTTKPEKEGFYNVITESNRLIISPWELGRWGYDDQAAADQSGLRDYVVRYRPSTYQPFAANRNAEWPCPACEDGEMIGGMTQPSGQVPYKCNYCGHTESYP